MSRVVVTLFVSLAFRGSLLIADTDWAALNIRVAYLLKQGHFAESELLLHQSIQAARLQGEDGLDIAKALNDLGALYYDQARLRQAERAYTEALFYFNRHAGNDVAKAVALGNFALLRLAQGKVSQAETLFVEAEHILTTSGVTAHTELAVVLCGMADLYWETKRYSEGDQAANRALAVLEGSKDSVQTGVALFQLGKIASAQRRVREAEHLVRRATEIWRISLGPQHPTYISGLLSLAVLVAKENGGEARRLFVESLQVLEMQLGPEHPYTGYALLLYAEHLKSAGRKSEARSLKHRADAIMARHVRENGLGHTFDIKAFRK